MKKSVLFAAVLAAMLAVSSAPSPGAAHQWGAGVQYFDVLETLRGPYQSTGFAPYLSYQYIPLDALRFEANLQLMEDGYAGSRDDVLAPHVLILGGREWYAGAGIGTLYSTRGDFSDKPFFLVRAGYNLELNSWLSLDLNVNYRFENWEGIDRIGREDDMEVLTAGVALRFRI
jgi:hypothetical protein